MTGITGAEQAIRERAETLPEHEGAAEPERRAATLRPLAPGSGQPS